MPKNNDPETLTQKLHARADRKLHDYIDAHCNPLWKSFHDAKGMRSELFERHPEEVQLQNGNASKPWVGEYWTNFKNVYFATMQPFYRDKEVREFMERVDASQSELNDLRELQEGGAE